jgi:hypothetical protein
MLVAEQVGMVGGDLQLIYRLSNRPRVLFQMQETREGRGGLTLPAPIARQECTGLQVLVWTTGCLVTSRS